MNEIEDGKIIVDGEAVAIEDVEVETPVEETVGTPVEEAVETPVEEAVETPVVEGKTYGGKTIVSSGFRTVNGINVRHVRLEDGSELDLSDDEYANIV